METDKFVFFSLLSLPFLKGMMQDGIKVLIVNLNFL